MATSISPLTAAILKQSAAGRPALIPYITAGYPSKASFAEQLQSLQTHAAIIEIGVPFSDPMADGVTIQASSRKAIENGVNLTWILDQLCSLQTTLTTPIVLMSYLNPLLTIGLDRLPALAKAANVAGVIVPDLPLEESRSLKAALNKHNVGLVQLVSPVTPIDRARTIAAQSDGFLYAVTTTGITGASTANKAPSSSLNAYIDQLRDLSPVPVCAGFGIRTRAHVDALAGHADGVIVGSALIDAITAGQDPAAFLSELSETR